MRLYNNTMTVRGSACVQCFNPLHPSGEAHPESVWDSNGWPSRERGDTLAVFDIERDNDLLFFGEPTSDVLVDLRRRYKAAFAIARARGIRTIGAYAWPWVRNLAQVERCVHNLEPLFAYLDLVMPSLYWYGESLDAYRSKTAAIAEACRLLGLAIPRLQAVPFVSIETMNDTAAPLPETIGGVDPRLEQMLAIRRLPRQSVSGMYLWSMIARWRWLWHLTFTQSIPDTHPAAPEVSAAREQLSAVRSFRIDTAEHLDADVGAFLRREVRLLRAAWAASGELVDLTGDPARTMAPASQIDRTT